MRLKTIAVLSPLLLILFSGSLAAEVPTIDGVAGIHPGGANVCLAVEIAVPSGRLLAGMRWYHNDETVAFPRLLLLEGESLTEPDLGNTALVLKDIEAESLAWGTVDLVEPVTSSTGTILAVFMFPPFAEKTAEGAGGGPAIGYRYSPGSNQVAWMSSDGVEWTRLHGDWEMAIDPVPVQGKGEGVTLASLRASSRPSDLSWRNEVQESNELLDGESSTVLRPVVSVYPNPFNPRTDIELHLEVPSEVSVEIYDARGRLVKGLLNEDLGVGTHSIQWLGRDDRGKAVASGVYFMRLNADHTEFRKRLILLR